MGSFSVIADVGNSLVKLLQDNMVPELISKPEQIGLCSPYEKGDLQLSLYLYNIEENGEFRPVNMLNAGENKLRFPPLSLTLYYLMTAYSQTDIKSRALDEQRILGKAIQVFYDNAVLNGTKLLGTLSDNHEDLQIELHKLPYDEMLRIWNFPGVPYKLSQCYRMSPVILDSTRIKQVKRVVDAEITIEQAGVKK